MSFRLGPLLVCALALASLPRTNVLRGITGVAAVVTVVLGVVTLGSPRGRPSAGAPVALAAGAGASQRSP